MKQTKSMKQNLKKLLDELITDGKDFSLHSNQTEITIYLESGLCVVLQDNNKWRLE